jgi:hypothetical protein
MKPSIVFYTKIGVGLVCAAIWVTMVVTKNDTTPQEMELIGSAKGVLIGLVTHLLSVGAPKEESQILKGGTPDVKNVQ